MIEETEYGNDVVGPSILCNWQHREKEFQLVSLWLMPSLIDLQKLSGGRLKVTIEKEDGRANG